MARVGALALLLWAQAAQGQPCIPYHPTVSSGWYGYVSGQTPQEVCQKVIERTNNPVLVSGGRAVYYSYVGIVQTAPNGWHCTFHGRVTLASTGEHIPAESGNYNWDGVGGPSCVARTISLSGDGGTKALPAGPAKVIKAKVTQNGEAAPAGVSVTVTAQGQAPSSGTTDAAGEYRFTYTPPLLKTAQTTINATCQGCSNTASHAISVEPAQPQTCEAGSGFGNPLSAASAEKRQSEADYTDAGAHPLHWVRHYRSRGNVLAGLGEGWSHPYAGGLAGGQGASANERTLHLGDGTRVLFRRDNAQTPWVADNATDSLVETAQGWQYTRASDETRWQLDASGRRLLGITQRNGWTMSLTYNTAGQLAGVTNAFGRSLSLAYNVQGQLTSATTPHGQTIGYTYNAEGRLAGATQSDGTSRSYLYDSPAWPSGLSGIVDETGQRIATYSYDGQGRATGTSQAGGAQNYQITYPAPDPQAPNGRVSPGTTVDPAIYRMSVQVTDPLGNAQTWTYQGGDGQIRVAGANGAYLDGQVAQRSFSGATTLPDSETDFLGITTLFTWDTARRLKTAETKAASRPEAQTTQTQWHPTYRLPVLVSEAGRTTAYTYDALGNKLTQTQTDTATGQPRTWAWTYDERGLVTGHTDPGGHSWTYENGPQGLVSKAINPLGHEERYQHDAAGRVTRIDRPGLAVQTYEYDARGRLVTQVLGPLTTRYSYTPAGQLQSVVQPNGHQVTYSYDAAQRLTGASDNRGNSVAYTLDGLGNRVREEIKDATGAIAQVSARTINHLNKVAAIHGASGQTTQIGYDANGEPVSQTDALNQTTRQTLDGLKRPSVTTFADNHSAEQNWNALDQLTQVTDPEGVATQYTYNAFGEVLTETSADAGTIRYARDANGRVIRQTDARGINTTITRDALGRPTQISRGANHQTTYTWDTQRAGYLARVEDKSGSTEYQRDPQGRITVRTQTVNDNPANPARFITRYGYQQGELAAITYPSGLKVLYQRDATGQIVGIDTQAPGQAQTPFITNLKHTALGQPKAWNWRNGGSASRTFDTDGRMVGNEFASYIYDAASRITGITQHLWATSTATGTVTTYTTPLSWTVEYDNRNRITGFRRDGAETRYTYDANSNRLTAVDKTTSDMDLDGDFDEADFQKTTRQNLNIGEGSNRLLGFSQTLSQVRGTRTISVANTNVNYTLDAAGNLTSDGLRTFRYDAANRMDRVRILKDGEAANIDYLHNALGQRVFKSEPEAQRTLPNRDTLSAGFIDWLKANFGWIFQQQATTSIGTAFVYADGHLPSWAILGDYDNGSTSGNGRSEYIWLPTGDGAIPVGMFRNGRLFAVHTDHLGTPRLMTNDQNRPVWQWPYSAFGTTKPTGVLKATVKPKNAMTNQPVLLKSTVPAQVLNLRDPGQYEDAEAGLRDNINRMYSQDRGRYTQFDPIGLRGGPNGFIYVAQNPLTNSDPTGLIRYNAPAPRTVPVEGETFNALVCLETCLKGTTGNLNLDLLVTGGAEKGSHSSKSHHYKGEACDVASPRSNPGVTDEDAKMCAKACGFGAGQYETFPNNPNRDHWHFQLTPGNGVPAL